ncbi:MAG: hypothetical protein J6A79_01020, partial [Clostridia bacterium]|nr:hypothetical protein [Clostridia bacterium]
GGHHTAPVILDQIGSADPDKAHRKQQKTEREQQRGGGKVFNKNALQNKFTPQLIMFNTLYRILLLFQ